MMIVMMRKPLTLKNLMRPRYVCTSQKLLIYATLLWFYVTVQVLVVILNSGV